MNLHLMSTREFRRDPGPKKVLGLSPIFIINSLNIPRNQIWSTLPKKEDLFGNMYKFF